jgi:hypothetical protein
MGNLGVDVIIIILKWMERKYDGRIWAGLNQNRHQWLATATIMLSIGVQ